MLAPHEMTSVQAGDVESVHARTTENVYRQQMVEVSGQTDILTMGLPYICPYNVHSVMNPILVMCTGLGYFFNLYRGKPLVRQGGVVIMSHPTPWEFNPVHHPSYIDFFEQVLAETTDPAEIEAKYEEQFATDPWYVHLYRTSHAYHGVHPFYMWYWGAHALAPPRVHGLDRLEAVDEPVIFAANHHSHLDTPLLITSLPERWRHRTVVAAAADYFFDSRVKGALSALVLGAVPVERARVD